MSRATSAWREEDSAKEPPCRRRQDEPLIHKCTQDSWRWLFFFQCHWHHLCVTPVQPLQYDASQPVLHCRQRMLEQPGSNHANLLRARLPEAQGKFFAQVQSHLRHESGKCWHCNRTVTKSPFSNSSIHAIKEKATPTIPTMCIVSLSRSRSTEMM